MCCHKWVFFFAEWKYVCLLLDFYLVGPGARSCQRVVRWDTADAAVAAAADRYRSSVRERVDFIHLFGQQTVNKMATTKLVWPYWKEYDLPWMKWAFVHRMQMPWNKCLLPASLEFLYIAVRVLLKFILTTYFSFVFPRFGHPVFIIPLVDNQVSCTLNWGKKVIYF